MTDWKCPHFSCGDCEECEAQDCKDRLTETKKRKGKMKFTKEDILVVRERVERGEIVEEIPHVKAIRLDKLREVVDELKKECFCNLPHSDCCNEWINKIDKLFGEVLKEDEVRE